MEYALFGLGRDADAKKSVFKAPTVRTDATAGEMAGLFYFLAKGAAAFASGRRGNVVAFDSSGDWKGTPATTSKHLGRRHNSKRRVYRCRSKTSYQ